MMSNRIGYAALALRFSRGSQRVTLRQYSRYSAPDFRRRTVPGTTTVKITVLTIGFIGPAPH
jgi:hypothetical protein